MPYSLTIKGREYYDERSECFYHTEDITLVLEHSLRAVYEWESIWNKPFLNRDRKTEEETMSYIKCMTNNKDISDETLSLLTAKQIHAINEYIEAPMTATTFRELPGAEGKAPSRKIITAEVIYYWMFRAGIPESWENRHLNQLLTMIRVCNEKDTPPKKMKQKDMLAQRRALNEARKSKMNSRG